MKKSLPAWERDGRELRSLPSMTRSQRSRNASSSIDTTVTSEGSGTTAVNASIPSTSSIKKEPVARCNVWTCLKIRPTSPNETPGRMIRSDQVDRSVKIMTATNSVTQRADQVYGPSASQAEINTTICIDAVPAIFSGNGSAVVYIGPKGSGKTSSLFAGPMEIPDPVAVPVPTTSGWPEIKKADANQAAAISSTHFGGLVPAFLSDILRRVADLTLFDITVSIQILSVRGDSIIDLLNSDKSNAQVTLQDSDVLGATAHDIETAADFAHLWGTALENAANDGNSSNSDDEVATTAPIICCVVSVERVDIRNGAVTVGTQLFLDIPPPESSTSAKLSLSALTKVICTVGSQEPEADLRKIFIPWRESKLTRVMHAALSKVSNNTKIPKMMIVGMLCPTADEAGVHESLATMSIIGSISKNRKGAVCAEGPKEVARRMQLRLETLCEAHRKEWSETQEELTRLRRENVLLRSSNSSSGSKGNTSIAKVLQVLLKEKIFKPEPGDGATMALISQLLSQIVVRERKSKDNDNLSGERWFEIISALQKAEPAIIPQKPPHRAADNPLKMATRKEGKTSFLKWYSATMPSESEPSKTQTKKVKDLKDEAFKREVSWLKSNATKTKKPTCKPTNTIPSKKEAQPCQSEPKQPTESQPATDISNQSLADLLPSQLGTADYPANIINSTSLSRSIAQTGESPPARANKKSESYLLELQSQQQTVRQQLQKQEEELLQNWTSQQQQQQHHQQQQLLLRQHLGEDQQEEESIDDDITAISSTFDGSRIASRSGSDSIRYLSGGSSLTSRVLEEDEKVNNFRSVRDSGFRPTRDDYDLGTYSHSHFRSTIDPPTSTSVSATTSVTSQLDEAIESVVEALSSNQTSDIPNSTPSRMTSRTNNIAIADGDEWSLSPDNLTSESDVTPMNRSSPGSRVTAESPLTSLQMLAESSSPDPSVYDARRPPQPQPQQKPRFSFNRAVAP
eukprot:TRINITY_DN16623_c0_g1_i1.p1 TRINITY_DN16623_c0_g1~~TRINITY_DN16623_c0_g1_i1.p1  ORF type:complete len:988 (+),score=210.92 TRINITY_DN16623_c0_g1_i1:54-2966(+)